MGVNVGKHFKTFLIHYGPCRAFVEAAMHTSEHQALIADPDRFEQESKRVLNKLRSDLDNLIAAEEVGVPLLHSALRRGHTGRKVMVRSGKDYCETDAGAVRPGDGGDTLPELRG
jgi:hypothetical protein